MNSQEKTNTRIAVVGSPNVLNLLGLVQESIHSEQDGEEINLRTFLASEQEEGFNQSLSRLKIAVLLAQRRNVRELGKKLSRVDEKIGVMLEQFGHDGDGQGTGKKPSRQLFVERKKSLKKSDPETGEKKTKPEKLLKIKEERKPEEKAVGQVELKKGTKERVLYVLLYERAGEELTIAEIVSLAAKDTVINPDKKSEKALTISIGLLLFRLRERGLIKHLSRGRYSVIVKEVVDCGLLKAGSQPSAVYLFIQDTRTDKGVRTGNIVAWAFENKIMNPKGRSEEKVGKSVSVILIRLQKAGLIKNLALGRWDVVLMPKATEEKAKESASPKAKELKTLPEKKVSKLREGSKEEALFNILYERAGEKLTKPEIFSLAIEDKTINPTNRPKESFVACLSSLLNQLGKKGLIENSSYGIYSVKEDILTEDSKQVDEKEIVAPQDLQIHPLPKSQRTWTELVRGVLEKFKAKDKVRPQFQELSARIKEIALYSSWAQDETFIENKIKSVLDDLASKKIIVWNDKTIMFVKAGKPGELKVNGQEPIGIDSYFDQAVLGVIEIRGPITQDSLLFIFTTGKGLPTKYSIPTGLTDEKEIEDGVNDSLERLANNGKIELNPDEEYRSSGNPLIEEED